MERFRFLQWRVYQDAKRLISLILKLVSKIPHEYRYELGSQLIRSVFSIILNIAEGSGKTSDRELNRFINISLGSVNETLAGIDVLRDNKFITESEFLEVCQLLESVSRQLGGFKKKISAGYKS